MYIHIKMFKSMLRVCNQHMPHFNALDSRGLPPNQGSAMDGWGTSDASEDARVRSGTVLKRPSHPAALGGVGLTRGGAPGVKPWMAATGARTGHNRSCTNKCDSERRAGRRGVHACHSTQHMVQDTSCKDNLLESVLSFTPGVLGIKLRLSGLAASTFSYFYFF